MTDRHKPRRDYMRRLMWAKRHVDNMVAGVANNVVANNPDNVANKQTNPSESPPIAENANLPPGSFVTEAKSGSNDIPTYEDPEAVVVSHTNKGLPIWYLTHVILPKGAHS